MVLMELLNNAHYIRVMDLGDLPQIWEKSPMFHWGWPRGGSGVAQGVASYTLVFLCWFMSGRVKHGGGAR